MMVSFRMELGAMQTAVQDFWRRRNLSGWAEIKAAGFVINITPKAGLGAPFSEQERAVVEALRARGWVEGVAITAKGYAATRDSLS